MIPSTSNFRPRHAAARPLVAFACALAALAIASCANANTGNTGQPAPEATPVHTAPQGSTWSTDLPVGGSIGDAAFNTPVTLRDETTATLEDIADGGPLLLYFFATWWPACRAEVRTLTQIHPEFADDVRIAVVGFDAAEGIAALAGWQDDNSVPFTFATGPAELLSSYAVLTQSTKFGIAPDGVIVYRGGYGAASADAWRERLRQLVASVEQ
jgi:thiol-disulfide isomerase/thioredoxin